MNLLKIFCKCTKKNAYVQKKVYVCIDFVQFANKNK